MASKTKYSKIKIRRRSGPNSAKNRALLSFVKSVANKTIKAIDLYSFFLNYQRAVLRYGWPYARELKEIRDERELRRRLNELKRRQFIQTRIISKHMELKLTDRGVTVEYLDRLKKIKDGGDIATIIIFDIPETESHIRRQLRLMLKQMGFKKVQQSVWARQADVYRPMKEYVKELKAGQWINIIRTSDSLS